MKEIYLSLSQTLTQHERHNQEYLFRDELWFQSFEGGVLSDHSWLVTTRERSPSRIRRERKRERESESPLKSHEINCWPRAPHVRLLVPLLLRMWKNLNFLTISCFPMSFFNVFHAFICFENMTVACFPHVFQCFPMFRKSTVNAMFSRSSTWSGGLQPSFSFFPYNLIAQREFSPRRHSPPLEWGVLLQVTQLWKLWKL